MEELFRLGTGAHTIDFLGSHCLLVLICLVDNLIFPQHLQPKSGQQCRKKTEHVLKSAELMNLSHLSLVLVHLFRLPSQACSKRVSPGCARTHPPKDK